MESAAGLHMDKLSFWRKKNPAVLFSMLFKKFRCILDRNIRILELMADMGDKLSGEYVFDRQYIHTVTEELNNLLRQHISDLGGLEQHKNMELLNSFERIHDRIREEISGNRSVSEIPFTRFPEELLTESNHALSELGNENIMMGEIQNILKLPVPDGFFVTTRVFFDFMEYNGLIPRAKECFSLLEKGGGKPAEKAFKDLRVIILNGEFPEPIVWDISAATENINRKSGRDLVSYAVRGCERIRGKGSVAFNPRFKTFLNIPQKEILNAYKEIIADLFCSPGLKHYPEKDFAVSASFYSMVDSGISGFIRTLDPEYPEKETMMVGATFGLGGSLKDVIGTLDHYMVSRDPPHHVLSMNVTRKDRMLTLRSSGGTAWMNIPHYTCRAPSLKPSQIKSLAETAILIERYYKRPLEITWCFNREENLFILRTNLLNVRNSDSDTMLPVESAIRNAKVLFSGKGMVVQGGIATGKVYVVRNDEDLDRFPAGAILVSSQTSPRFSRVIRKTKGILTGIGSPTGHMATMAREFRVPTIVNCGIAVKELKTGDEITIDAAYNVVYCGVVKGLQHYELIEEDLFEESEEYLLLRRLLKHVSPLNLIDPHGRNFTPSGCRSYHDILRYVHEKAVQKVIDLSKTYKHRRNVPVRRLETDIPLGIFLAEIDEKIKPGIGSRIQEKEVNSVPMRALLQGLHESGMWSTKPLSVDMGSFMSSLTKTFSYSLSGPDHTGMNLALISGEYMNLNLRLGYHFTVIDAFIGDHPEENRISFRFFGGVTDFSRRSMRVKFIGTILERFDFRVESHGDLVVGRIKKAAKSRMIGKMKLLGGLIGYTRQLDVQMSSESNLAFCVEDFINKIKGTMEVGCEQHDQ
jgi:pyruvate,water dikinase